MELRHLRYFVAVAEELHFGRAARRLGISQPPLSMAIRELEDDLEARLFHRTSRNVELSLAGRELLEKANGLLRGVDVARKDVARAARGEIGTLEIGYATAATYGLLTEVLVRFRRERPDVRLALRELRSEDAADAVRGGELACAFVCLPVADDGLVTRVMRRDPIIVALPAAHPLAKHKVVPVAALDGVAAVQARPSLEPAWSRDAAAALARAGVAPEIVEEADSKLAILALVAAGVGIAVVAESTSMLARPGIVFRPIRGLRATLPLGITHRKGDESPMLAALLSAID